MNDLRKEFTGETGLDPRHDNGYSYREWLESELVASRKREKAMRNCGNCEHKKDIECRELYGSDVVCPNWQPSREVKTT